MARKRRFGVKPPTPPTTSEESRVRPYGPRRIINLVGSSTSHLSHAIGRFQAKGTAVAVLDMLPDVYLRVSFERSPSPSPPVLVPYTPLVPDTPSVQRVRGRRRDRDDLHQGHFLSHSPSSTATEAEYRTRDPAKKALQFRSPANPDAESGRSGKL